MAAGELHDVVHEPARCLRRIEVVIAPWIYAEPPGVWRATGRQSSMRVPLHQKPFECINWLSMRRRPGTPISLSSSTRNK
ncbi:MAG: hypothetical protein ABSH09_02975 [Bryobacteraceae bacterium]|jgi:hypothetical protein